MLYLDKCWRELQELLGTQEPLHPRTAYGLVSGSVTLTDYGWIPFIRLVEPGEVAAIAADLALVGPSDVTEMLTARTSSFYADETIETAEQYILPGQSACHFRTIPGHRIGADHTVRADTHRAGR
jgi:hypothetical protein